MDQAINHPLTFLFAFVLTFVLGIYKLDDKVKRSNIRIQSYLNPWTLAYFVVMCLLTSLTTSSALYLLLDDKRHPRVNLVPNSFLPLLAAVVGMFGFEFLVRKFVIGFGENQWDLNTSLDNLAAHAVSATLLKEAE